ncbi:MAG: hypothetical protein QOK47_218, partial [Actinomycetota bacterium]|nr:hypothetical protein [Actinomycetota bacterium]
KARGTANMQADLAQSQVGVEIKRNDAAAREAEGTGQAAYIRLTGEGEARKIEAIGLANATATEALGLARAKGFEAQKDALGGPATALVNGLNAIADGKVDIMPEVLVTGGGGSLEGLAATLMRSLGTGGGNGKPQVSNPKSQKNPPKAEGSDT